MSCTNSIQPIKQDFQKCPGIAQNQNFENNEKDPSQTPSTAPASTDGVLLALAKKRSEQIQNQMVSVHGIAAKRIIACKPKIAEDADAKPQVDLAL